MDVHKDIFILCVDDESSIVEDLELIFKDMGFQTLTALNPEAALVEIKRYGKDIALILSDFQMGEVNGFQFRESIPEEFKSIPFAILSGHVSREMALKGVEHKICAFLDKPFTVEMLKSIVEKEATGRIASIKEERELLEGFHQDATNLLEEFEPLIMSLEGAPQSADILNNMYRILHTIKGTSGFFDQTISKFAHKFEDCLTKAKNGELAVTPVVVSSFLKAYDRLNSLVATVKDPSSRTEPLEELLKIFLFTPDAATSKTQTKQATENTAAVAAPKAKDWIKVSTTSLDDFMEHSGQITVIRNMVNKLVRSIEKEHSGNKDVALLGELLEEMHNINSAMQDKMVELRKQPLKETFRSYPRLIRDLTGSLQKEIDLKIEGEDLKVDTAIGEVLNNSLVHMLRNCCDHGIETPEDREKQGKARQGTIHLRCYEKGEDVIVELQDDGKGIDPERIKAKLKEKAMFTDSEIAQMSRQRIFSMIFEAGFSTAAKVTDVSGRGVGMDMVRTSVEKIRGSIDIQSEIGRGTKFTLKLPIPKSVLIINSLMVESHGQTFAIPQDDIQRLVSVEPDRKSELIAEFEGAQVLKLSNGLIPLVWLDEALELNTDGTKKDTLNIVVARTKHGSFGIVVDAISHVEDAVVKPLGRHLAGLTMYSGGTFLGDGKIGLIINPENLAYHHGVRSFHEKREEQSLESTVTTQEAKEYLVFELATRGIFAIELNDVYRLEEFSPQKLQYSGAHRVIVYREQVMPVISLREALDLPKDPADKHDPTKKIPFVVLCHHGKYFALMLKKIVDIAVADEALNTQVIEREGFKGTVYLKERTTSVVDVKSILLSSGLDKSMFENISEERELKATA